ncbi:MAG: hypothetical protein Q4C14_08110 [Bacillota bacterium]|nr:hypothetical protein [Bacillota bacterium]
MDRISVLISGMDSLYNEMLAAALMREGRNFSVSCASAEILIDDRDNRLNEFDVILADNLPSGPDREKFNVVLMSEKAEKRRDSGGGLRRLYKYQSVKSIVSEILEASGKYNDGSRSGTEADLNSYEGGGIRIIGVSSASYGEGCGVFARILAGCLSVSCGKTVLLDMSEGLCAYEGVYKKREGCRTWDDFIYCCTYGKTGDIFEKPEVYASESEYGFLFFPNKGKNSNPFKDLDSDEIRKFYSSLRLKLNMEFVVNLLPEKGRPGFHDNAGYQDVIVLADEHNFAEEIYNHSANNVHGVQGTFNGRILKVCLAENRRQLSEKGFYVSLSGISAESDFEELAGSQTWEDVMKVAGYINEYGYR